jgi:tRNA uridine 5-carbamoylmethylation protein Kti12
MRNPQAFKEYQQARKENRNPNEFLNEIVERFTPEQKQQWNTMMNGINTQK